MKYKAGQAAGAASAPTGNNIMTTKGAGMDRVAFGPRPSPSGGKTMTNMPGMVGGRAGSGASPSSNPLTGKMAGAGRVSIGAAPGTIKMAAHKGSFSGMKFPGSK